MFVDQEIFIYFLCSFLFVFLGEGTGVGGTKLMVVQHFLNLQQLQPITSSPILRNGFHTGEDKIYDIIIVNLLFPFIFFF